MQVQPYLFFDGRCEEALEFYKKAIDAKVEMLMRFKDAPDWCWTIFSSFRGSAGRALGRRCSRT